VDGLSPAASRAPWNAANVVASACNGKAAMFAQQRPKVSRSIRYAAFLYGELWVSSQAAVGERWRLDIFAGRSRLLVSTCHRQI